MKKLKYIKDSLSFSIHVLVPSVLASGCVILDSPLLQPKTKVIPTSSEFTSSSGNQKSGSSHLQGQPFESGEVGLCKKEESGFDKENKELVREEETRLELEEDTKSEDESVLKVKKQAEKNVNQYAEESFHFNANYSKVCQLTEKLGYGKAICEKDTPSYSKQVVDILQTVENQANVLVGCPVDQLRSRLDDLKQMALMSNSVADNVWYKAHGLLTEDVCVYVRMAAAFVRKADTFCRNIMNTLRMQDALLPICEASSRIGALVAKIESRSLPHDHRIYEAVDQIIQVHQESPERSVNVSVIYDIYPILQAAYNASASVYLACSAAFEADESIGNIGEAYLEKVRMQETKVRSGLDHLIRDAKHVNQNGAYA